MLQGSILSPILFDIYIDDLINEMSDKYGSLNIFAYADDILVLADNINLLNK